MLQTSDAHAQRQLAEDFSAHRCSKRGRCNSLPEKYRSVLPSNRWESEAPATRDWGAHTLYREDLDTPGQRASTTHRLDGEADSQREPSVSAGRCRGPTAYGKWPGVSGYLG